MESITVYTISMHEQKALFYKATHLSQSQSSTTTSSSSIRPGPPPPPPPPASISLNTAISPPPSSHQLSPPAPAPALSRPTTQTVSTKNPESEFLKQFLRASPDLFRFQKLYDESFVHLFSPTPSSSSQDFLLPNPTSGDGGEVVELARGERGGGGTMVISQVRNARMKLLEWCKEKKVDYEFVKVGEGI